VPSVPLPSGDIPPPSPGAGTPPTYGGPARPPTRHRTWLTVAVLAVVAVLVLPSIAFVFLPTSSSSKVIVTTIHFTSLDNACGVNDLNTNGFNASPGESLGIGVYMYGNSTPGGGTAACTIHSLSTITPGFSITETNVPLGILANKSATLKFTVNMPGSAYTGVLTLVVS